MTAPAPALDHAAQGLRPSPGFVEWLMGLPPGWVTGPGVGLTGTQQLTALGNGVLPLQAVTALKALAQAFPRSGEPHTTARRAENRPVPADPDPG